MRIACTFSLSVVFTLLLALPPRVAAQEAGEGCRILFLDDLLHPFCPHSDRNPFEERIETERHDFTQSATTVGRGVFQVEAGYTYYYKDHEEEIEQTHAAPELLLRFGLTDDIEFRVRWDYAWRFVDEGDDLASAEDLRPAIKLGVTEQDCWVPESALDVRMTVPTGGSSWSTEHVEFGLDYIYVWEVGPCWEVFGSTGFGTNGLGDFGLLPEEPASERFMVWSQSAGVGCELTERTTLYAEYFGLFSRDLEEEFRIHVFNIGVDYYVTDDLVVDLRVGKGLSDDADDMFVGVGGGFRF